MHDLAEDRGDKLAFLWNECNAVTNQLLGKNMVRHFFDGQHPPLHGRAEQHLRQIAQHELVDLFPDQLGIGAEDHLHIAAAKLDNAGRAQAFERAGVHFAVVSDGQSQASDARLHLHDVLLASEGLED
ncbi:hypothetical protein D3C71_1740450 [compost metagenome]